MLPPLFDCSAYDSEDIVKIVFPSLPSGWMSAYILFHLDFLQNILSPSHPLFLISFFTSRKVVEMKNSIIVEYTWEEDEGLQIVGTDGGRKSGGGQISE